MWRELDDPVSMQGHPIALQVVGRKLQEEKTLAGMKIIEEIVKVK
jgi:Asp-tRNA(Asn)/Glu-tRNA(Gln) amidotransferase A subunit family amidase